MAELQYHQWQTWNGGIDDSNQKPGGQYFSHGIDTSRKPSYLAVADAIEPSIESTTTAAFSQAAYWFQDVDGDLFAVDSGGDIWKRDAGTGWVTDATWPHADGNAGSGQGLFEYNGSLFWAADTTVGRITTPTAVPAFTDSWQAGLTTSSWHPMEIIIGKLAIGHGRNVATWDTTSWDATSLILPAGFVAKCFAVIGDFLAIGTVAPAGEDSRIFFWDGTSATYNKELSVKAEAVDAMFTWRNTLWVVAGKAANLHYYNGTSLAEVAKIADIDTDGGDSATVRPSGLIHYQNRMLIAVETISTALDRAMPGVWAFDPETGAFTLQHLLSTGVSNTSGHAYAVYSDGTDFWVSGSDGNTGAAYATFVDKSGGSKYTESCYFTTQWFETVPFANKHFRKFYLNFFEFPASGATNEITVKYRLDDTTRRLNSGGEYTATGGGAAYVDVASTATLQVGDEITISGGPSSGDLRRIITLTATRVTVDRNFSATPVNAETKFFAERWTEIDTVNITEDANKTLKDFWLVDQVGKKIQFKIELRDGGTTGEEVAIADSALSFIQKPPT